MKRDIQTKYGCFHFELLEYPGPSPILDIWFGSEHIGYGKYINLETATDAELLETAIAIESN